MKRSLSLVICAVCLSLSNLAVAADLPSTNEPVFMPMLEPSPVLIRYRATLSGHPQRAQSISFSPDGRLMASSGSTHSAGSSVKQNILVRDVETGSILHAFQSTYGATHDVAFSPSGDVLATAEDNGEVRLFDPESGEQIRSFRTGRYSEGVPALSFMPDGEQLVIATNRRGGIALWRREGTMIYETKTHTARAWDLAVSSDGRWAVTGSADRTFAIWDAATGKVLHNGPSHKSWVTALAISPDNQTVAVGDFYSNIRIWDIASCEPLVDFRVQQTQHLKAVHALKFSVDGRYLVSSEQAHTGETTRIWDARSGELLGRLDTLTKMVLDIEFSPDGKTLALACPDGTVKLFDWESSVPAPPDDPNDELTDNAAGALRGYSSSRRSHYRTRCRVFRRR